MYRIKFAVGSEIVEIWDISDIFMTHRRLNQIVNNLQWWHHYLVDGSEFISAAIEKGTDIDNDGHTVLTVCEFLDNGIIHRTIWDTSRKYNCVARRSYPLGGVK